MLQEFAYSRVIAAVIAMLLLAAAASADPVAQWRFGTEETSRLVPHGGVHRDVPGPRPPEFPDFEVDNLAVKLDGKGAHFSFADPGDHSPFQFTNGDAITLEAWVNIADINPGENVYVIGKGRTEAPGYARDNQNWALRVREVDGSARLSFLFATKPAPGEAKDAHWHRWTSAAGFADGGGWHHLAVGYQFGKPDSARGWVDGQPIGGSWDMGGASAEAPIVDNDAIWIGSSLGGRPANSFRGLLDEVAIHRELLPDSVMRSRYRRNAPGSDVAVTRERPPVVDRIPAGKVLITFREGLSGHDRWPGETDSVSVASTGSGQAPEARWIAREMALPRLPVRYDDWGLRAAWQAPVLVLAAADLHLSPGKHRFLLRARGLGRLWINGVVIARTKPIGGSTDGHEPVHPIPAPPLPGMRTLNYGDQESFGEAEIGAKGRCRAILETIVGGKKFRPEPGELCAAVESDDGKSFLLLRPDAATPPGAAPDATPPEPLTDAVWSGVTARIETELAALDDETRRAAAASQDAFWANRHEIAARWVAEHPAPPVPQVLTSKEGAPAHPIDAFIAARIDQAVAASASVDAGQAKLFNQSVQPIFAEQCVRCHGEKHKGDLLLNSRQAALRGGSSGKPAVVPGDPGKSEMIARLRSADPEERMPPKGDGLPPEQIGAIELWIKSGAPWPEAPVLPREVALPSLIDDAGFLRRAYLDTVGVLPSEAEAGAFLSDGPADKRPRLIDHLLTDARFADQWMGYWQDVFGENPSILKPSLNNSGPFRWFLYDALRDGKPIDRLVTELIVMRGGKNEGGSAGFAMAADNDAPLAGKGQVLGSALLGLELQCARCHDSPFHSTKQRDLYALAAMLDRKAVTVPKTSTVPAAFFERKARESLIKVTLKPGEPVSPVWPFEKTCQIGDDASLDALVQDPKDGRQRLAALITAPRDQRFARVMVNRVWKRLIGAGIVEPAGDWEGHAASHPELLDWLAAEFVGHGYDLKHVVRIIMTSQLYERQASGHNLAAAPERRYFAAPDRRRMTGEQVVDALFTAAGKRMDVEELTFDPGGRQAPETMISLGKPRRAWMFASLSNERDRPSLSLPRAQAVTDVLEAFGWSGARQNPRTDRESDPNVLQPGVLANSIMSTWVTRVSADSGLSGLALRAGSPEEIVDEVFLRFLTRLPDAREREQFAAVLRPGFAGRVLPPDQVTQSAAPPRLPRVTWSNHLMAEASEIKLEMERRARAGDPPDPRLAPSWREAYEDVVWSVINSPEFVWVP